jgi:hypothetical protein
LRGKQQLHSWHNIITTTMPAAAVMASEKHHCPFEGCSRSYKKPKGLKDHLIIIVGTQSYDRIHSKEDPLWAQLREQGFLKVTFSKAILLLTFGPGKSKGKPHGAGEGREAAGYSTKTLRIE